MLNSDAQRDQGEVNNVLSVSLSCIVPRTADLDVLEVDQGRESADEMWHVRRMVKERRPLPSQELIRLEVAILRVGRCARLQVGRVSETQLVTSLWVYKWWQKSLLGVWHGELERLDMVANAVQYCQAHCFEGGLSERDSEVIEKHGRSSHSKFMAHQAKVGQVCAWEEGDDVFAAIVLQPKPEESCAFAQDKAVDTRKTGRGCLRLVRRPLY